MSDRLGVNQNSLTSDHLPKPMQELKVAPSGTTLLSHEIPQSDVVTSDKLVGPVDFNNDMDADY